MCIHQITGSYLGKLDALILGPYYAASVHLTHANGIMENISKESDDKRRNKLIQEMEKRLDNATESFIASIAQTREKNPIIHIESEYYAGVCFSLKDVPSCALYHFNEVYNKGHELWNQYIKKLNKLRSYNKNQRKDIVDKLVYLYQYMEPVKRIVENSPSTPDNVASTSNNARGVFKLQTLERANINIINEFYNSGKNHERAKRYEEAIGDYSRTIALAGGNYAGALIRRGDAKRMLKGCEGALQDLYEALKIEPNSAQALGTRGQVYQAMGQHEEALADFNRALAIDSSLGWVKTARAEVKARIDDRLVVTVGSSDANYRSISDAIKYVPEKTCILVRPGTYIGSIVLDKDVEIVGDGPREQIVLISNYGHCIDVATDSAAVVHRMTIRGRSPNHCAIDIPRGHFHLSDCIVTCETQQACIEIHNSTAQPHIEKCIIRDGGASGIFVYDQGAGIIEDCDIYNNQLSGVEVTAEGNPIISQCEMHDGQSAGIHVYDQGEGSFENCDIYNNKHSGVAVSEGGKPLMRHCQMHGGQASGINVFNHGEGTFEDCDIYNNQYSGVQVTTGGNPLMSQCKMHGGQSSGIYVFNHGEGTFEDCDIYNNQHSGVQVTAGGNPLMSQCKMHDEQAAGIHVYDQGEGSFENCDIYNNKHSGVAVSKGGKPLMRHCQMHGGQTRGIHVDEQGEGTFEDCETFANRHGGLYTEKGSYPVTLRCTFQDGEKHYN